MNQSFVNTFKETLGEERWTRLLQRIEEVNKNIKTRGIRPFIGDGGSLNFGEVDLLTGYAYNEYYDWDLYFENIYMSYFGISRYCRNNLEVFLSRQLECGFTARTLINPRMRQHFKPFLAQNALLGSRQTGNFIWLKDKYYTRLKKYLEYWFHYSDFNRNGLCIWESADHSGMDNQDRRAGKYGAMEIEGVDLNCYLVRELQAMAIIAEKLGLPQDQIEFEAHAEKLNALINEVFWDEEDGFYYDRSEKTGNLVKVKSIAGFMPLWSGSIPKERAERIVKEHLLNKDEFWLEYPLATWAKSEEDYYQEKKGDECNWMGTCWIPTNYAVFHGLMKYGYMEVAKELAYKTFEMVLNEEDTREYYNAETGCGQGLNPFWGWSTLAYFMPLEYELKYDPTNIVCENLYKLGTDYLKISF